MNRQALWELLRAEQAARDAHRAENGGGMTGSGMDVMDDGDRFSTDGSSQGLSNGAGGLSMGMSSNQPGPALLKSTHSKYSLSSFGSSSAPNSPHKQISMSPGILSRQTSGSGIGSARGGGKELCGSDVEKAVQTGSEAGFIAASSEAHFGFLTSLGGQKALMSTVTFWSRGKSDCVLGLAPSLRMLTNLAPSIPDTRWLELMELLTPDGTGITPPVFQGFVSLVVALDGRCLSEWVAVFGELLLWNALAVPRSSESPFDRASADPDSHANKLSGKLHIATEGRSPFAVGPPSPDMEQEERNEAVRDGPNSVEQVMMLSSLVWVLLSVFGANAGVVAALLDAHDPPKEISWSQAKAILAHAATSADARTWTPVGFEGEKEKNAPPLVHKPPALNGKSRSLVKKKRSSVLRLPGGGGKKGDDERPTEGPRLLGIVQESLAGGGLLIQRTFINDIEGTTGIIKGRKSASRGLSGILGSGSRSNRSGLADQREQPGDDDHHRGRKCAVM